MFTLLLCDSSTSFHPRLSQSSSLEAAASSWVLEGVTEEVGVVPGGRGVSCQPLAASVAEDDNKDCVVATLNSCSMASSVVQQGNVITEYTS